MIVKEKKTKIQKLNDAHENNLKISSMNLQNKFSNFEQWELNKSNRMLYEIYREKNNQNTYKRFRRGSIIRVDFGVNVGGEFSNPHFALVVSKADNMFNNILTVVPLTSKQHIGNIKLGQFIISENIKVLKKQLKRIRKEIEKVSKLSVIEQAEFIPIYQKELEEIQKVIKYYETQKSNISYAFVEQIRTISKYNIISPINKYDIINNLICPNEFMDLIDKEIIRKFTDIDIKQFEKFENKNLTE